MPLKDVEKKHKYLFVDRIFCEDIHRSVKNKTKPVKKNENKYVNIRMNK